MRCVNTYYDKKTGREFNCGKCMPCRINYTTKWTLRLLLELSEWDTATFLTLTYDDEHLPADYGLHYEDVQKFWKLLRRRCPERNFKYYCCGEYGDTTQRPHYHAIVYGLDSYSEDDRKLVNELWKHSSNEYFYLSKDHKGMLPVCREDIQYVAGYVRKKLNGELAEKTYQGRSPPFSRCSHGIGLEKAKKEKEKLAFLGYTTLHGKRVGIPKYLRDKLGIVQTDLINKHLSKEEVQNQGEKLFEMYCKEKNLSKEDFFNSGHPNEYLFRRFENWVEDYLFKIGDVVNRQFIAKNNLRGSKI